MLRNVTLFLLTLCIGGAVALGGWWTLFLRERFGDNEAELAERQQRIELLTEEVSAKDAHIDQLDGEILVLDERVDNLEQDVVRLETSLQLIKVDHRLAELEVLEQFPDPEDPEKTISRVRFVEFDVDGVALGEPKDFEIRGKSVYVETLIVKFEDSLVESGDPLRGSSICLFRRLFGEDQEPSQGEAIDTAGTQPLVYGGDTLPDPSIEALWRDFWDLANDPDQAQERGVRAMHGEAPFIEVRPGKKYQLTLRASGGLSIKPLQ